MPSLTINQQTAFGTPEITFNAVSGGFSHTLAHVANGELRLQHTQAGINTLILENLSASGYAAIVARQTDATFPSTNQDASGSYEHMAVGYGRNLASNGRLGFTYIESSRFNGASNAAIRPSQLNIQQTGGAYAGTVYAYNAVVTSGSASITINGGGNWPADVNGMMIREQGDGGFFTEGTTVLSGQGTATITLSANALQSNGFVPVFIGTVTYGQYNAVVFRDMTGIEFYKWSSGANSTAPYAKFDRINGRVGFGAFLNSLYPVSSVDVLGNVTAGTDTTQRTAAFATYPYNIADTGTAGLKWLKVGVNTFQLNWNATPSRVSFYEANGAVTPLELYMDATARTKTGGGRILAQRVVTAAGAITVATSDDVIIVNKSVGAATTVNLFATPAAGTRLIIKDGKGDALANNITITPAAGTIDGAATLVILTNYGFATIEYNGTEWGRIG
jgi:hypothetical protein